MDKGNSLGLPTSVNARQHLGTKKKSDSRNVHPGYSMHEWNVLCQSGQDLTGGRGGHSKVTLEELEKHCTEKDAWTAVRGKVYNITHFMKFHPGGKAQLMRGAGNDCTELFDKIHIWVSSEHILEKCLVGILDTPKNYKRQTQAQSLGVANQPVPSTSFPVNTQPEIFIPVPVLTPSTVNSQSELSLPVSTTPAASSDDQLSLQMLKQARIQSHESQEEDVQIPIPEWIQPPSVSVQNEDIGTSVDAPVTVQGYETEV